MALTPFFNRDRSIFDPLFSDRLLDPFFSDRVFDPFSVFEHAPSRQFARDASAVANTRVDWVETPDAHVFKADLPGLKKEEIKIEVENGKILKISGERKKEETEKTDRWHRVERVQGSFLRSFRLPDDTKMDEIKAQVDHGVLTVTVPKTQQPKPEVRSIEISG